MLTMVLAFAPVALLLTITPGAATALVVRNAAIGGQGHALLTAGVVLIGLGVRLAFERR